MGTTRPYLVFHTWEDEAWESVWHIAQVTGLAPVCGGGEDDELEMSDFDRCLLENEPEPTVEQSDGFIGEIVD